MNRPGRRSYLVLAATVTTVAAVVAVGAGAIPAASADNPPLVSTVTPYLAHVSIATTPDGRGYLDFLRDR